MRVDEVIEVLVETQWTLREFEAIVLKYYTTPQALETLVSIRILLK